MTFFPEPTNQTQHSKTTGDWPEDPRTTMPDLLIELFSEEIPARMQERQQKRMHQRMDQLKVQLKLTPAQEGAWTTFTQTMQPNMQPKGNQRQEMAALTTPERIDRMRTLRSERMAEADRRGEAAKAFYATLTPEQQKTFDAHTLRQHRKDGHRGGDRHGMR